MNPLIRNLRPQIPTPPVRTLCPEILSDHRRRSQYERSPPRRSFQAEEGIAKIDRERLELVLEMPLDRSKRFYRLASGAEAPGFLRQGWSRAL